MSSVRENVQSNVDPSDDNRPAVNFSTTEDDYHNNFRAKTPVNETDPKPFLSLQLNSEYRSTYQWHDFKPPLQTIGVAGKSGGTDTGIVVVKRPPQPLFGK